MLGNLGSPLFGATVDVRKAVESLAEFSTDAVLLLDAAGLIRWASPSTADVLGYDPQHLQASPARELVMPDDVPLWDARQAAIGLRHGMISSVTCRCCHRDGSIRWISATCRNLLDEPRIGAIVISLRDVTDAREIEEALKSSEERYRQLFEGATDLVFEFDQEGYFQFVNPATLRTFGYSASEVVGRRFTEFVRVDYVPFVFEHYRRQTDSRQPTSYLEFPAIAKDGREIWLGQNAWIMTDGHDRFCGMRAVSRNITEQRRAEEALRQAEAKYRSLVEQSLIAVYILQGDSLVYVNPRAAELVGYSVEELLAMPRALDVIADRDRAYVREQLDRLVDGDAPSVHFVARARRKDGQIVQAEAYCAMSESGGRPAILATVIDVTERVKLEDQLRHAHKMEAVGRLAGGIAHDFNNLLTAIRGNAELLYRRLQHDPVRAAEADEILLAADRAASLTRQLLAFSRKQDVSAVLVDVNDLVENVARMARRLIGPDVSLEAQTGTAIWQVYADPSQIEQVLLNLILNARDALPDGGRIRVRTANIGLSAGSQTARNAGLAAGNYVLLEVSDNGIGMDQATQTRIFEPFFTTKEPGRGTGLGLSTVYGTVRHMGGAVEVQSARNEGSTFSVFLPASSIERITASPAAQGQEA